MLEQVKALGVKDVGVDVSWIDSGAGGRMVGGEESLDRFPSVKERVREFSGKELMPSIGEVGRDSAQVPPAAASNWTPSGMGGHEDYSFRSYSQEHPALEKLASLGESSSDTETRTSIELAVKMFESDAKQTFGEEFELVKSDRPLLSDGARRLQSRMQQFAKSESVLLSDEREKIEKVRENVQVSTFSKDELEHRRAFFSKDRTASEYSGSSSHSRVDAKYDDFRRRLSQAGTADITQRGSLRSTPSGSFGSRMNSGAYTQFEDSMDFTNIADVIIKDEEECNVDNQWENPTRKASSRKVSTVDAGLHQYSFATSRHVAENLNQTNLRLQFENLDSSASLAGDGRNTIKSTSTLMNFVAQFQYEETPMYYTLRSLLTSVHPGETCPLVVEIPRIEHPYDGLSTDTCFLALVTHKARKFESALFFVDPADEETTTMSIRFVVPLWGELRPSLSGDGALIITNHTNRESFKLHMPSLQSMWTTMNALDTFIALAKRKNIIPNNNQSHAWLSFYDEFLSDSHLHADGNLEEGGKLVKVPSRFVTASENSLADSGGNEGANSNFLNGLSDEEREKAIVGAMRDIMTNMIEDLDNVTFKMMYCELGKVFSMDMKELYKPFIDEKLIMVLGQMEAASVIIDDFLYLGTEWNASNFDELERRNCGFILNMTKEIESFFPDKFVYMRRRIVDVPEENILSHLDAAVDFITSARQNRSSVLVHCQMGVSRSASTVIAYVMRTYGVNLDRAYRYVKRRRDVVKPNKGFWEQLKQYEKQLDCEWEMSQPDFMESPKGL